MKYALSRCGEASHFDREASAKIRIMGGVESDYQFCELAGTDLKGLRFYAEAGTTRLYPLHLSGLRTPIA